MQRLFVTFVLELYAIALAMLQAGGGVQSDEAKYLLNIPYPHPPAVRWVLAQFDAWHYQETFVRVLFATLMVQAVWLVWDMVKELPVQRRYDLAVLWLFSGGVILQAGTVMMAPLTALQALVFLWMAQRRTTPQTIGLFWLFSLFTAYQAVLFLPLAYVCLQRQGISRTQIGLYLGAPIILLALYTLVNPLIPASMVVHSSRDLHSSLPNRLMATGRLWLIGGSVFLSLFGTWGMFASRRWELITSFFLVCAYIALSRYDYYAVLFLPLFVAGVTARPKVITFPRMTLFFTAIVGMHLSVSAFEGPRPVIAREVIRSLSDTAMQGTLLVEGSFGHQWQYESPYPVRAFLPGLLEEAGAVVCLTECPEWNRSGWKVLQFEPEVWVREKWLG
ncbi:hypothetical protein COU76_00170 [Candidatus Peregrinibacteria bacterium CG10_big_fil_rev_8_21_14_0_10_49_10]|nr:MAG: hypothetical protein COU76_00170 [Candidatus Peregrinibacteria bacterium CG10_big_fil_rev_8_21_14_0_10_49_10]